MEAYSTRRRRMLAFWFASLWFGVVAAELLLLLTKKGGPMPVAGSGILCLAALFFLLLFWVHGMRERRRLEREFAASGGAETHQTPLLAYGTLIHRMTVCAILVFAAVKIAVWTGLVLR